MSSKVNEVALYRIKVRTEAPVVVDIPQAIAEALEQIATGERFRNLKPGASIGITVGSRGIANYLMIIQSIVKNLQNKGFQPFLFSSMGSHGRGEAAGQQEVLESLGFTEETAGCRISCSSEVEQLDELHKWDRTIPVYCAKEAWEADGVIVVNRIKPHTSFHGDYESGLLKMMTVGMGRAKGANVFHSLGAGRLADAIPLIGQRTLELAPVIGGIGIMENANEQTAFVEGAPKEEVMEREKQWLMKAKELMPKLPVEQADLCIVKEMGKNYSGTGMDTNIIGRLRIQGVQEPSSPSFTYIGVLRLSEPSHGNATGIGLADFTTEALARKIDKSATYLNCLTSGFVIRAAVPMTFETDRSLFEGALQALKINDLNQFRMIAIRNTLHIDEIWVSKAIYEEIKEMESIELVEEPRAILFDQDGNWIWNH